MRTVIKKLIRKVFVIGYELCERLGFHITPDRFNYPIPSANDLSDDVFRRKSDCIGINWNLDKQEYYINNVFNKYATEVEFVKNKGLSLVDAAIYHSMIRHKRPKKIIEVGSGDSTKIAARACTMNKKDGNDCELISIEPFPDKELQKGYAGLTRLIEEKVQFVGLGVFENCDILFIDSSHVVKINSDVNYEMLEIIPRLRKNCLVHFHDIFLPGEYWKLWVKKKKRFWTEQYLLHAFLQFNSNFEIIWASKYQHLNNAIMIKKVFPYFKPEGHLITSFWIRRKI